MEPLRANTVLLIFSKASFQIERELDISKVEKLKKVTGKVILRDGAASENDKTCKISNAVKSKDAQEDIENIKNSLNELFLLVERYNQAASTKNWGCDRTKVEEFRSIGRHCAVRSRSHPILAETGYNLPCKTKPLLLSRQVQNIIEAGTVHAKKIFHQTLAMKDEE